MRRKIAIVVGIVVAASCVPWLRHQHFFSVLVGVTTLALFGLIVFGGWRCLKVVRRIRVAHPLGFGSSKGAGLESTSCSTSHRLRPLLIFLFFLFVSHPQKPFNHPNSRSTLIFYLSL